MHDKPSLIGCCNGMNRFWLSTLPIFGSMAEGKRNGGANHVGFRLGFWVFRLDEERTRVYRCHSSGSKEKFIKIGI